MIKSFYSLSKFLPLLSVIFLLLLYFMPFSFENVNQIKPFLALSSVFFWLTHRPDEFGVFSVIIVSLFADALSATPMGTNLLMFFCLYLLTNKFEAFLYNKPFFAYWCFFTMFSFVAIFLKWFVLSVFYSRILPVGSVLFMYLTTALSYPIVSLFNAFVQTYVRTEDER